MIAVTSFAGKKIALFGLGGSGLATAKACKAGGADIVVWDDSSQAVTRAEAAGLNAQDLRQIDWGSLAALILSPGVPLTHPEPHWSAALAAKAGVEIIGDIELFARERSAFLQRRRTAGAKGAANFCPFIAITGTNGKSTTTALIAHLLRAAGYEVQMGGNIGLPVLELAAFKPSVKQAYVVEVSSYQIDLAPSLAPMSEARQGANIASPTVGILLNITPDHIDRHGSFNNYAAIKERLVAQSQTAIIAYDDAPGQAIYERLEKAGKKVISVRLAEEGIVLVPPAYSYFSGDFLKNGDEVLPASAVLHSRHNVQNTLCALAACSALGAKGFEQGLRNFKGLPHRMEEVGRVKVTGGEIVFINDSKATNADSVAPALQSFENIYWLAGGRPKAGGIESLTKYFPHVRKAYLIGEAAEDFAKTLEEYKDGFGTMGLGRMERMMDKMREPYVISDNLEKAVEQAVTDAKRDLEKGYIWSRRAVILLSPACASFDQFKNFEERGKAFAALAAQSEKQMKKPAADSD